MVMSLDLYYALVPHFLHEERIAQKESNSDGEELWCFPEKVHVTIYSVGFRVTFQLQSSLFAL